MPHKDLTDQSPAEDSTTIRQRVNQARKIQHDRLTPFGLHANSQMQARHIRRFCKLDEKGDQLLEQVTDKLGLSAHSFTRILKLARTITVLAGVEQIGTLHLAEAIQYRGIVTNRDVGGNELVRWYRERCGKSEEMRAVMKDDLAGRTLPSGDLGENAA